MDEVIADRPMAERGRQLTVWIFQTGEPLPSDEGDPRPMRAMNLANMLVARGSRVVIWSSAFFHQEKRHRSKLYKRLIVSDAIEVRLIPSMGYQRNIGFTRLADHAQLAVNLYRALRHESEQPDVGFVGYPPIEFAAVAVGWLKRRGIPVLLDAKDQWPDIFIEPFPSRLKPLVRLLFSPYYYLGRRAMRNSTALSSMTESFVTWMREFSGRASHDMDIVAPLSSASSDVSEKDRRDGERYWEQLGVGPDGRIRFIFVGSLSQAFDFFPIQSAARRALAEGLNWQFVICGDGGMGDSIRTMFRGMQNVVLAGWVDRSQIVTLADMSVAGLAPYRDTADFQKSIPNKVIDYMSLGLPIVSPLTGEVRTLIDQHGIGISYDGTDSDSLAESLQVMVNNEPAKRAMVARARDLYQRRFSLEVTYGKLASHLAEMAT